MPLADYQQSDFTFAPWTRPVYRRGSGPAVVVIHEIPGLHPQVIAFADRLVEAGMTVFMPSLFGTPGKPVTTAYALQSMVANICIRREFNVWNDGRSSPIVDWLRALARHAHAECGGPGVGAIGMCFTGGFALAMMTEPAVIAPVLSQPSMPIRRAALGSIDASPAEVTCARRRFIDEDLTLLGLRYKSDRLVPDARFDRYTREFGDRFERVDLDDADARPDTGMKPHSVLTIHLPTDGPGKAAETRTIAFFRHRLGLAPTGESPVIADIPPAVVAPAAIVLPGGTRATDTRVGTGPQAMPGQMVAVHYTGWLWQDGARGKKFDSSLDRGEPFVFALGSGQVILGWDEGVAGMKVGGKRTLVVPAAAGYGDAGAGSDIPPGATLLFEVELLGVQ